jgi:hypothetical protein
VRRDHDRRPDLFTDACLARRGDSAHRRGCGRARHRQRLLLPRVVSGPATATARS